MFLVCAPGSVAWQPGPGWRLLHGIIACWKHWHLSMKSVSRQWQVTLGFAPM